MDKNNKMQHITIHKPKKPWYKRVWLWILIIFVFFIIIGAGGSKKSDQQQNTNQISTPAPEPKKEEPPKTWQKVIEFSGNTAKRSDNFTLTGGQARLKYTVSGSGLVSTSFYVMKDGTSLEEDGGFPETSAHKAGSDETRLVKPAGAYYLDVNAANATWTVTIEELK